MDNLMKMVLLTELMFFIAIFKVKSEAKLKHKQQSWEYQIPKCPERTKMNNNTQLTLSLAGTYYANSDISSFFPLNLRCSRRIPGISDTPRHGDGGFRIILDNEETSYILGKVYTVILSGLRDFIGFQLLIEDATSFNTNAFWNSIKPEKNKGKFMINYDGIARLSDDCPNVVVHSSEITKSLVKVRWKAPIIGAACIALKATVIVTSDEWYMDDGHLTRVVCPSLEESEDKQPEILDECDACSEAKYQIIFKSLISKYTHTKDLPPKWLIHFSELRGASHNDKYTLWEPYKFASKAIQNIAIKGDSDELNNELRMNMAKLRTIIRGRSSGFYHKTTFATFRVDRKHHLLSFISKLIPSPDWFVGVSNFELCLKNHTWIKEKNFNLYLWDAGVNSGLSYTSPLKLTSPQEVVYLITSGFPKSFESPFYNPNGTKIKPVAKIKIKLLRLYDRPCSFKPTYKVPNSKLFDYDREDLTDKRDQCAVTAWSYSLCEGEPYIFGNQLRNRSYINQFASQLIECKNQLIDIIACLPDCDGANICAVSEWLKPFEPCNNTCGHGYRKRYRKFLHPKGQTYCDQSMLIDIHSCHDRSACKSDEIEENESKINLKPNKYSMSYRANRMKYPEKICFKPPDPGPCLGPLQERWFYNFKTSQCESFQYSGCSGNENNFLTESNCKILCQQALSGKVFDLNL